MYLLNKAKSYLESWSLPKTVECLVRGQTVLLRIDSRKELKRAKSFSNKEPNTLGWLDDVMKEGDVLYDIGANIGQYSLYPAKKLSGKCQIYAFEPEALNFAKLNINISLNDLSGCIKAYPIALSGKDQISDFYINKMGYGQALHHLGKNVDNMNKSFEPEHVQGAISLTLDSLVYDYSLKCPNHIKLDIDGLEKEIIEGGKQTLSRPEVKSVLVEVSKVSEDNNDIEWFVKFFADLSFESVDYHTSRRSVENLIFVKK